jgi:hypothetical protein
MKKFVLAVLFTTAPILPARAWDLSISGQSLTWNGSGTSPTFTVGIENNGVTGTDYLAGWSLGLTIAPEAGAVGTLSFATASLPSNYLLNGNSEVQSGFGFIPSDPNLPATSILPIADVTLNGGVTVPNSGDNLLALTFVAGPGTTSGVFDVFAMTDPGLTLSYWAENNSDFTSESFGNFTTGSDEVLLGTVTIGVASVPEPNSGLVFFCGLVVVIGFGIRAGLSQSV